MVTWYGQGLILMDELESGSHEDESEKPVKRECLLCERLFTSVSNINRLCNSCKKSPDNDGNSIL